MDGDTCEHIGVELGTISPGSTSPADYLPTMFGAVASQDVDKTYLQAVFTLQDNFTHPTNATHISARIGCFAVKHPIIGSGQVQTLVTLADSGGNVYWKRALSAIQRRDPPVAAPPSIETYKWLFGETLTGVQESANAVTVTANSGDTIRFEFAAQIGVVNGTLVSDLNIYVVDPGSTKYTPATPSFNSNPAGFSVPAGSSQTTILDNASLIGWMVAPLTGNYTVGVETSTGTGSGVHTTIGQAVLNVTVVPAPAGPTDTFYFFDLDDIPIRRGAGTTQSLYVIVSGYPDIDYNPPLPSNPHTGTVPWVMDVKGWRLGS